MLWIFSTYSKKLSKADQLRAIDNFKNAALYDVDSTTILAYNNKKESLRAAGLHVLSEITEFYKGNLQAVKLLDYQIKKLTKKNTRYAEKTITFFKEKYTEKVIK